MASHTPGILLKLLQSMNSTTTVSGDHRSPLLQVIKILPALSAGDSLWTHHGFNVQLSDSLNSTYVLLSGSDADLILTNKLQCGQFVHLDRLVFDSPPVPTAVNLRPILGRHGFVRSPDPLIARATPSKSAFVIQLLSVSEASGDAIADYLSMAGKKEMGCNENLGTKHVIAHKENVNVNLDLRLRDDEESRKAGSRSSLPEPSKCALPSLAAAKEENQRASKEPAIVVPSRYRKPSSTVGRRHGIPLVTRRLSLSQGRRLSGGVKVSPGVESSGEKRMPIAGGIPKVSDALMGSGKPSRNYWDNVSEFFENKEKVGAKNKPDLQAILRTQAAISMRPSVVHETSDDKSEIPMELEKETKDEAAPVITIHKKKGTDGSVSLDMVSPGLEKLGKEAMQRRKLATAAAAEVLEGALTTEWIVKNFSMFSDLVATSKPENPLPTIEGFMNLYEEVTKSTKVAEAIAGNRDSSPAVDNASPEHTRSSNLWVEAALTTNPEVFSLLTNEYLGVSTKKDQNSMKRTYDIPPKSSSSPKASSSFAETWTRGTKMDETIQFGKSLKSEMQLWFSRFVKESLNAVFCVAVPSESGASKGDQLPAILSQLKLINDWLDRVAAEREGVIMEKIDRLKLKMYGFVMSLDK